MIIETGNAILDGTYVRQHAGAVVGCFVMLSVSDTGRGMGAKVMSHIFEPFFTTKGPGEGTGLGLATVYGVVKQSGGYICVYSEPDKGTTFRVYLPRTDAAAVTEENSISVATAGKGSETVLLVEDNEQMREFTHEVLQQSGYTVLDAHDTRTAIQIAAGHAGSIDLLLSDMILPGIGGRELAKTLRATQPGARALYLSGYASEVASHAGELDAALLEKPFTSKSLLIAIRKILDSEKAGSDTAS